MSYHACCPNCNANDASWGIYKCNKCGKIFCSQCAVDGWSDDLRKCPECRSDWLSSIGMVDYKPNN